MVSCIVCQKQFSIKGIHTHYERAHGSLEVKSKYSSGFNGKYHTEEWKTRHKLQIKAAFEKKNGEMNTFTVSCLVCNKSIEVIEPELSFPLKEKYFCSRSCSNTRIHSDKTKQKISESQIESLIKRGRTVQKFKQCKVCQTSFAHKHRRVCSNECKEIAKLQTRQRRRAHLCEKRKYRKECQFEFSIKDFPGEFNTDLIQEHGWYKASNRGNNLTGVARDHKVSVEWGWKNKISPNIIKHPANCELMLQNQNQKKRTKCSITLDELLQRIDEWNKKWTN
jgi:predicted nucleic acid-binding Zn ribbon protein